MSRSSWAPYVPVAKRRANAEKLVAAARKKGIVMRPVVITGRAIAQTFWGKAWCSHLEDLSDFDSRLPRGRTYVRNGSVIDLRIGPGYVEAQVMGSSLYQVKVEIAALPSTRWLSLKRACSGQIDSLVELLQGKFSKAVMAHVIDPAEGLFPRPSEIKMKCSCPDYAGLCKHVAATLYGIGAALDTQPEHLFLLRQVDHLELVATSVDTAVLTEQTSGTLTGDDLGALFGIELAEEEPPKPKKPSSRKSKKSS